MNDDRVHTLVLQEFRLSEIDDGTVARIVAQTPPGLEAAVPLLTSIDDRHDVATIRALRAGESTAPDAAQRVALEPLVSRWQPERRYASRIAERSQSPPTYYRLAVTESGINDPKADPPGPLPRTDGPRGASSPLDLLWIGRPHATYAGLLVLLGKSDEDDTGMADPVRWPLLMSQDLGVRIYDSRQ